MYEPMYELTSKLVYENSCDSNYNLCHDFPQHGFFWCVHEPTNNEPFCELSYDPLKMFFLRTN